MLYSPDGCKSTCLSAICLSWDLWWPVTKWWPQWPATSAAVFSCREFWNQSTTRHSESRARESVLFWEKLGKTTSVHKGDDMLIVTGSNPSPKIWSRAHPPIYTGPIITWNAPLSKQVLRSRVNLQESEWIFPSSRTMSSLHWGPQKSCKDLPPSPWEYP